MAILPLRSLPLGAATLVAALSACALSGSSRTPQQRAVEGVRRLHVIHFSDMEAELVADGDAGGIGRFVGLVEALRLRADAPTVTVAVGDVFMTAPALDVELDGANAVDRANGLVGIEATALGNHEFDRGEAFLAERIRASTHPWLTATVDVGAGPLAALPVAMEGPTPWLADHPGRILSRGLLCAGAELLPPGPGERCTGLKVGVIGATTETLATIASVEITVGLPVDFDEVVARLQVQADALAAEGIDLVILLSHLQDVRSELRLVEAGLTGVDLILSGGGEDRLANPGDRLLRGHERHPIAAAETSGYPLLRTAADGRPVAIASTDGQYRYVGSLGLRFDGAGTLVGVEPGSRPWPVDDRSLAELGGLPSPVAAQLEERVRAALAPRETVLVQSEVFLDGERDSVRNRETNLGNLAADSLRWAAADAAPAPLFALRNGGGIRGSLGRIEAASGARSGTAITPLEIEGALRFDNELALVTTTHRVLVETLESGLRGAGTGRGHFPQASAELELVYDPALPEQVHRTIDGAVVGVAAPGSRVRSLVLRLPDGGIRRVVEEGRLIDPEASVTFVTLDYLARGGDGWFPGRTAELVVTPLPALREREVLARYLAHLQESGRWQGGAAYAEQAAATRIVPRGQ